MNHFDLVSVGRAVEGETRHRDVLVPSDTNQSPVIVTSQRVQSLCSTFALQLAACVNHWIMKPPNSTRNTELQVGRQYQSLAGLTQPETEPKSSFSQTLLDA